MKDDAWGMLLMFFFVSILFIIVLEYQYENERLEQKIERLEQQLDVYTSNIPFWSYEQ